MLEVKLRLTLGLWILKDQSPENKATCDSCVATHESQATQSVEITVTVPESHAPTEGGEMFDIWTPPGSNR